MSKTFVSPGVFTQEIDASYLAQGVSDIGGAFIGAFEKGPAFVPIKVGNFNDVINIFGDVNTDYKTTYFLKSYLRNAGTANIVRVLGPSGRSANGNLVVPGYTSQQMFAIVASGTLSPTGSVMALVDVTASAQFKITDLSNDLFYVSISGANMPANVGVTASFISSSANYITKVLNSDAKQFASLGYFVRKIYDYAVPANSAASLGDAIYTSGAANLTNFQVGYAEAVSPWIQSQEFSGQVYNLFKIHTLGHGNAENGRFKVSISNIKPSPNALATPYGTFTLLVRQFTDTDSVPVVVESFPNCTMDPTDRNYIGRQIGDMVYSYDQTKNKVVVTGNYPSKSQFIRVELNTATIPNTVLPWGFDGMAKPSISSISDVPAQFLDLPYVKSLKNKALPETDADIKTGYYWGLETELSGNVMARFSFLPNLAGKDAAFTLANVSGSNETNFTYVPGNPASNRKSPGLASSTTTIDPNFAKFTVPLGFGFNGLDPRLADPFDNASQLAQISQIGTQAMRQAIDIISDPGFIDINLLAIPGVWSNKVVEYALAAVENRADAFYVMDLSSSSVDTMVNEVNNRGFNTNYGGVYYSDVIINDVANSKNVQLPGSFAAVAAIAYTDRVSYPWFAPAGTSRGGLSADTIGFPIIRLVDPPTAKERDKLYDNRVNPITSFSNGTTAIWGQKTLQIKDSALNRINVRRLLIRAKKLIASAVNVLVFEPNNPKTWQQFEALVNPILQDIQLKNGLERFRVTINDTTNTPDLIDRNIMSGKIELIPTRSAEFISVDFVIGRSGASFDE